MLKKSFSLALCITFNSFGMGVAPMDCDPKPKQSQSLLQVIPADIQGLIVDYLINDPQHSKEKTNPEISPSCIQNKPLEKSNCILSDTELNQLAATDAVRQF